MPKPQTQLPGIDLLIIGDIHFPQSKLIKDADVKDTAFPANLKDAISIPRLSKMVRETGKHKVDGTIILGDLTTQGDIDGYRECAHFLHESLNWGDTSKFPSGSISIVPGNHDIKRRLVDNVGGQYIPLTDVLKEINRDVLPISAPGLHEINSAEGNGLRIFSLNSCIGCGSKRGFPEALQTALEPIITDTTIFNKEFEGLDTPGLEETHIDQMISSIESLPLNVLPIVALHHNLLPQYLPRLAPYTELINGGYLRSRLLQITRPIILLHGHIHRNYIEKITTHESQIICISATEFAEGFITLRVHYSTSGYPIGASVNSYSPPGLATSNVENHRFNLYSPTPPNALIKDCHKDLYDLITSEYRPLESIRTKYNQIAGTSVQYRKIAQIAEELEWFGLIDIQEREYEPKLWRLARRLHV